MTESAAAPHRALLKGLRPVKLSYAVSLPVGNPKMLTVPGCLVASSISSIKPEALL